MSGSWPGEISIFRGSDKGWLEPVALAHADGKPVKRDGASSVALADWDRDGDLDLVVGFIQGPVSFYPNVSKDGALAFGAEVALQATGREIEAHDAGPCVADWDLDGDDDLLVGQADGSVALYRAKRVDGAALPELDKPEILAKATDRGTESGRAKPYVADWNDDGRPDLLVGDFGMVAEPDPVLTEEQTKTKEELKKRSDELMDLEEKAWDRLAREASRKLGLEPGAEVPVDMEEKFEEIFDELCEKDETYAKITQELDEVENKLVHLEGGRKFVGRVWVYLRR